MDLIRKVQMGNKLPLHNRKTCCFLIFKLIYKLCCLHIKYIDYYKQKQSTRGSVIKRSTDTTGNTSEQTDTTSGQTSTKSGETNGQASTTSGKRVLRMDKRVLRVVKRLL